MPEKDAAQAPANAENTAAASAGAPTVQSGLGATATQGEQEPGVKAPGAPAEDDGKVWVTRKAPPGYAPTHKFQFLSGVLHQFFSSGHQGAQPPEVAVAVPGQSGVDDTDEIVTHDDFAALSRTVSELSSRVSALESKLSALASSTPPPAPSTIGTNTST